MRTFSFSLAGLLALACLPAQAATVYETCPSTSQAGDDVACYPLEFIAKTEMHPAGIPIIAYLFVRKDYPHNTPIPALVLAHGSGSMYSSANHNKGLNTKQKQWVRQYTQGLGIPTLHVDSFQSRYLLPDTAGDQRMFDWRTPPAPGTMGGDDYRATSTAGGQGEDDPYVNVPFDPDADDWKDQSNGGGGVSEVTERPYDMEAAYEFLVGNLAAMLRANGRGTTLADGFTPGTTDTIANLVPNLVIDPAAVGLYGTSHGGQTALATADEARATSISNPMGLGGPNNDGRRFAVFFDYYGGCSMYGAFGGVNNSTWKPHGPFVMLHGEADPIWTDGATGSTVAEQFASAECGQRMTKAKAMPGFNTFLEAVLYKGAEHSFDGVEVDDIGSGGTGDADYPSWLGKVHSNYQIVVPMLEALRQIAHAPAGSLSLADFGFHSGNPWFTTFPFDPSLPPQATFLTQTDNADNTIAVGSMTSGSVDISQYVNDPFDYHSVTYSLAGAPAEISIDANGMLSVSYAAGAATGLNTSFLLIAESEQGQTVMEVTLTSTDGITGELTFGEAVSIMPTSFNLGDPSSISVPLNVLTGGPSVLTASSYTVSNLPAGLSLEADNITLSGSVNPADLPTEFTVAADMGDLSVTTTIQLSLNADGEVIATAGGMSEADLGGTTIDLPLAPLNPPLSSGSVSLTVSTASVNEADGTVTLTVTRTGDGSGAVSVDYATAIGTAGATDFTATSGSLNWADGDTASKSITVTIADDSDVESDEDFTVTLSNPTGASLATPNSVTVTINDNDTAPTPDDLAFSVSTASVNEADGTVTLTVTRTGDGSGAVSVDYATAIGTAGATDFTAASGTLNWADGDTASKSITITIADDSDVESDEDFTVTLSNPTGASLATPNSVTVTINDNDTAGVPTEIKFASSSASFGENSGTVTISVTRTGSAAGAVSVDYATVAGSAGSPDFTPVSGTLNWADGDTTSKTIEISITDDTVDESIESFTVALSNPAGAVLGTPNTISISIQDNDDAPTLDSVNFSTGTASVNEADGTVTLTVTRTGDGSGAVSVDYATATGSAGSSDFTTASGTLHWADGDTTSKTITITIVDDSIDEANEVFTVRLSNISGATLGSNHSAAVNIVDNDTDDNDDDNQGGGKKGGGGPLGPWVLLPLLFLLRQRQTPL